MKRPINVGDFAPGPRRVATVSVGEAFGCFVVVDTSLKPAPHYGTRVRVRCSRCGLERIDALNYLRSHPPSTHRRCAKKEDA